MDSSMPLLAAEGGAMFKRSLAFLSVVCLSILEAGCMGTLREYQPKSSVETSVKEVLANYETAYNKHDLEGIVRSFHQDAEIVSEGGVKPFPRDRFRVTQFRDVFPQAMASNPVMALSEPYIFLTMDSGDKAVLEVLTAFGKEKVPSKFSMILDGNRWLIMKILYY